MGIKFLIAEDYKIIIDKVHCGTNFYNIFTQNCTIVGKLCFIPWHNHTI